MARRTKEEAEETRQKIISAAENVFYERGVAHTTLDMIAREAGVTRGAIYWHFKNKLHLFTEMHERVNLPMREMFFRVIQEGNREDNLYELENFCIESLTSVHEDERLRKVYTVILLKCEKSSSMEALSERNRQTRQELTTALTSFFDRLLAQGQIRSSVSGSILALAFHSYMIGIFTDYLSAPESYSMPEDARALMRVFFDPLRQS
ncbi:TetR family transcriptional regulator [Fodinicurvata sediminis]|uniref:TetR family transcriptional regulator n=1 Tax=Fodinicurvata sediminis TaxID=1121832 RepID=UPI0003B789FB|nr:TetR family transcriptional regulator [Fodinicurvata sediminis]